MGYRVRCSGVREGTGNKRRWLVGGNADGARVVEVFVLHVEGRLTLRDTLEDARDDVALVILGVADRLDELIRKSTGIDVTIAENAEECVAVGAGIILKREKANK